MKSFFKYALTALLLSCSTLMTNAQSIPDFAFPKKVETTAKADYEKAVKSRNWAAALRALVNYSIAEASITPDSASVIAANLEKFAAEKKDPAASALAYLFAAKVYEDCYLADRYVYNNRTLPLTPLPDNMMQWSGAQFRNKITSLCDSAIALMHGAPNTPVYSYRSLLDRPNEADYICRSINEFVLIKAIDLLSDLNTSEGFLPAAALVPTAELPSVIKSMENGRPTTAEVLSLYNQLITGAGNYTFARLFWDIRRIDYTMSRIYPADYETAQAVRTRLLTDMYKTYSYSEAACLPLLELANTVTVGDKNAPAIYSDLRKAVAEHSTFPQLSCLKNRIKALESKSINIDCRSIVSPGDTLTLKISSFNVPSATLTIYRLPDNAASTDNYSKITPGAQVVERKPITFSGEVPFSDTISTPISLNRPGRYIAVPTFAGASLQNVSYPVIAVTSLCAGAINFGDTRVIVTEPLSGAPVLGADILYIEHKGRTATTRKAGASDADGFFVIKNGFSGNIRPAKGNDTSAPATYIYSVRTGSKPVQAASLYTDLGIYRPGDSVEWACVAYTSSGADSKVMENVRLKIIMRNSNGTPVDTVTATTDAFGRATGSFVIPKGDLTGSYSISAATDSDKAAILGRIAFTVSDYKLPTFAVEITAIKNDIPAKGDVTITGRLKTYSGMPVAGADISVAIASLPHWWRGNFSSDVFFNTTTSSNSSGEFEITLIDSDFALAPHPDGAVSVSIDATSQSGESHSASKLFTRGAQYRIYANIPSNINVQSPVKLDVKALSADNTPAPVDICYKLVDSRSDTVAAGKLSAAGIDLSSMQGGVYTFIFSTADNTAKQLKIDNIALYKPTDAMPPRNVDFWLPQRSVNAGESILFGTSKPETYVLYTLWTSGKVLKQKWIKTGAGIHTVMPEVPAGAKKLTASFYSVSNYRPTTADVTVNIPDKEKISIVIESWRDKLRPGDEETWKIKVVNADSTGTPAAVILDMYNSAMASLAVPSFTLYPRKGYEPSLDIISPIGYTSRNYGISAVTKYLNCTDLGLPQLNTYGKSFHSTRRNGMVMYARAAGALYKAEAAEDEMVNVVEHKASASVNLSADYASDAITEEPADESGDAGAAPDNSRPQQPFSFRDSEVALAFFAPMLTTDADGNLSYTFTTPNANTSWSFNALAFTKMLQSAGHSATVVANKPVMVQPNLPRFVRAGDSVVIMSTVFNNDTSTARVSTEIELFNPADNSILKTCNSADTIAGGSSAVVSTAVDIPSGLSSIGFRIKSSTATFADGEQSLIPVLPSWSTTFESTDFYIPADSHSYTVNLPKYAADSKLTLTYCDNPLWYVVSALPGLQNSTPESANSAAGAIFSAAVAKGLVDRYPQIRSAIEQWSASDKSDSTLVSMLERNSELKAFLLQATPWVGDAMSDTERMQRLALLYNNKEYERSMSAALDVLAKLQNPDGGFAWMERYPNSSLWATTSVLTTVGQLNSLGLYPDNKKLGNICSKALDYIDRQYSDIYARNPNADFTPYLHITSLWPSFKESAIGRSMVLKAVQKIVGSWQNMNVENKARAVLLLKEQKNLAKRILESINEFAVTSPEKGAWWPSLSNRSASLSTVGTTALVLQAYTTADPGSPMIDKIRQWLILQKANMNWGNSDEASRIIAAILISSPRWIEAAGTTDIKLGNSSLNTTPTPLTGEISLTMHPGEASGAPLTINRSATSPAWGGVIAIGSAPMNSIEAASCSQLSISKRMLVKRGDKWQEASSLQLGDKVKVQLTVVSEEAIDYVAIRDERAACLEPVDQLPGSIWADGICFYRENRDASTNIFIDRLPKGSFVIEYEMWVNNAGEFAAGIATAQSQYSPQITAHSAGSRLQVTETVVK
jgi:hypothetical protein